MVLGHPKSRAGEDAGSANLHASCAGEDAASARFQLHPAREGFPDRPLARRYDLDLPFAFFGCSPYTRVAPVR